MARAAAALAREKQQVQQTQPETEQSRPSTPGPKSDAAAMAGLMSAAASLDVYA